MVKGLELFLRHARAIVLLNRGRYAEAQPHLEAAIRIGESMGDRHLVTFDEVYRAECLVLCGSYAEAARELERLSRSAFVPRARRMALARVALLHAFAGDGPGVAAAVESHRAPAEEREVPYLDAWDDLFLGWALSISGDLPSGRSRLAAARSFFLNHRLAPGLSLARFALAESLLLGGSAEEGREALAAAGAPGSDLTRILWPLLRARLSLEAPDAAGAGPSPQDLLAEAGAAMVGNRLFEWEARLGALRADAAGSASGAREVERLRKDHARELRPEARRGYLRSRHWKAWTVVRWPVALPKREQVAPRRSRVPPSRPEGTEPITPPNSLSARSGLVARSPAMKALVKLLDRLREVDLPVLIRGETGTGKEFLARIIHQESRRSGRRFMVVDCAAIPPGLVEVELFGARAGAFTGLAQDRRGLLALAAGGTVLIDEIAGVPGEIQSKLLRVISEGTFRPLGHEAEVEIEARFLFSTSRDLDREAAEGRLRPELLHRIRGLEVVMPPLRERIEDLPLLVETFLGEGAASPPLVTPTALARLGDQRWPGNIRELRNLLWRLRLDQPGRIGREEVDRLLGDPETTTLFPRSILGSDDLPFLLERLEREYVLHHLRRLAGSTQALGQFLGLGPRQLYRRLTRLKISLRNVKRRD